MKTDKIRLTGLIVLFALLMLMNLSCGGGGGSSSSGNVTAVSINMTAVSPGDIVKLRFTISAPDMVTISKTVDVSVAQPTPPQSPTPTPPPPPVVAAAASGDTVVVHFDVPNGLSRHVVVEALDAAGTVIYIGDTYVDLDGIQKSIEVTLNPVGQGQLQQCNNLVQAGGNTPETHTVELGVKSGVFNFRYDTFIVKDRMLIKYEGNILYDSGCVGTNGQVSESISYSGTSSQITVEVQPNCAGSSGTAWAFTVTCPL